MVDSEDIEYNLELPIGTRFYFQNRLCEVIESGEDTFKCLKCAFFRKHMCQINSCYIFERHDGKCVFFNEVKQSKEEQQ